MSGETLGPLLRKMAAYTSTENHKRPPPRGLCLQRGFSSLRSPIQCNRPVVSTYCDPSVLSGLGCAAELDGPGLSPRGSFWSDGEGQTLCGGNSRQDCVLRGTPNA